MLKHLFLAITLCAAGHTAAAEWQHNNPDFDRTGQVTLKTLSGATSQLSNTGQQGLQSSASPSVLFVSGGGDYEFDMGFLLQSGDYLVREVNLKNWLKFNKADFESQFTVELVTPLNALSENTATRTSATFSASGSGSATSKENGVGSANVSCSLAGKSDSSSGDHNVSVSVYADGAYISCNTSTLAYGARVQGVLYVWAEINSQIYNASNQCSKTFFSAEKSNCFTQCTASGSGSTSGSCSVSDTGYVTTINSVKYGFSSTRHFTPTVTLSNKKTINFSGINKAYVDPANNVFFLQRGTSLSYIDPKVGDETLIAQLNAGDVPTKMLTGLKFTKKTAPVTP
jgi:hypothetical protein